MAADAAGRVSSLSPNSDSVNVSGDLDAESVRARFVQFQATLAHHKEAFKTILTDESRDQLDRLSKNLEQRILGDPHKRIFPDVLERELRRKTKRARRETAGRIKTAVAKLAQRHRSEMNWLSLANDSGSLKPIVVQSSVEEPGCDIRLDDLGIVPRVGRTRQSYVSGDVRNDPFYGTSSNDMKSEQTVVIVVDSPDTPGSPVLATINQESRLPAHFHPASVERLREQAQVTLTPLLRELEALGEEGTKSRTFPCLWRPGAGGWGLYAFMTSLLEDVKEEFEARGVVKCGMNNLHLSVWYADLDDRVLSWFASTGFNNGVPEYELVEFDQAGVLGRMVTAEDWTTECWRSGCGVGHLNQSVHDAMGTVRSRFVTSPKLSAPGGAGPFRIIVQVDAFTPEADVVLPDDVGMQRVGRAIFDQVKGYLRLYPRLAADAVLKAIHQCRSFTDQWHAVAEAIETVLRAEALTLYARPWNDKTNLHVIAATAPLKHRDGKILGPFDPDTRPVRSLIPSPLKIGERSSYAGVLAGRPGAVLVRVSAQHSRSRLEAEGFPASPSPKLGASLSRTAGTDRRCLGYALPNVKSKGKAIGVAVAVRSTDLGPFKAWDAAALVAMLDAAAPVIRSWREWAAPRLPEAQRVIRDTRYTVHKMVDRLLKTLQPDEFADDKKLHDVHEIIHAYEPNILGAVLDDRLALGDVGPHRKQDPIPRSGSLRALSREIAADAHERARAEYGNSWKAVIQAAVLMEARGDGMSVMHEAAYFHEHRNRSPRSGTPDDPRLLRIPGFGGEWRRFLDNGRGCEFRSVAPGAGGSVSAGVRLPFLAWIGRHAARGALVIDLRDSDGGPTSLGFREDLMLLVRRLAAGWSVAGTTLRRGQFYRMIRPEQFTERLREHLGADVLELQFGKSSPLGPWTATRCKTSVRPLQDDSRDWCVPSIPFHRPDRPGEAGVDLDAELWGVRESIEGGEVALRVPLPFATYSINSCEHFYVLARWSGSSVEPFRSDPQTTRALWIRDIVAAWMLWSWSWTREHPGAPVYVDVESSDGAWTAIPRFYDSAKILAAHDSRVDTAVPRRR